MGRSGSKYKEGFSLEGIEQFKESFVGFKRKFNAEIRKFLNENRDDILDELRNKNLGLRDEKYKALDTGLMAESWKVSDAKGRGDNYWIEITNDAYHSPSDYYHTWYGKGDGYYASLIEYGFRSNKDGSWFNGRYICTDTMDEFQEYINEELPNRIEKLAKECGIG